MHYIEVKHRTREHVYIVARMEAATAHPARFDPSHDSGGTLIAAEHRGRYWWASQIVDGKKVLDAGCGTGYGMVTLGASGAADVTGVDIDPDAVAEAGRRYGDPNAVLQGDLRDLPFPGDSFDVVVCWETIEHIEGGDQALDEIHRVLRQDGVLLVSSPNPDVYPPGNEHHVHEYRPAELAAMVGERFAAVASYRQHSWLASVIESTDSVSGEDPEDDWETRRLDTRATMGLEAGGETYALIVATNASLPVLDDLVIFGNDFEVGWWAERVAAAESEGKARIDKVEAQARERVETIEVTFQRDMATAENEARREIAQAEARASATQDRLGETSAALLDANQALAQLPLLQHRLDEASRVLDEALAEAGDLRGLVAVYNQSNSWRITAPLRKLRRFLRFRR